MRGITRDISADRTKLTMAVAVVTAAIYALYYSFFQPSYFTNTRFLGGLIFLEILAVCLWEFRKRYLVILILAFLWAGMHVPFQEQWESGRWIVLAIGAVAGCLLFLRERTQHFRLIHLVAFCCVLTAAVSALVSASPLVSMLKSGSLLFLFLYAAAGARLAIIGREEIFFRGLLIACEMIVYITGVAYLVLRWALWGNPNSMGLVMSVVMIPVLFWGVLVARAPTERYRRSAALFLAVILLLASYERAGLAAAATPFVFLCIGLRRYKLLVQGVILSVLTALIVSALIPLQDVSPTATAHDSFVASFLYKGKPEGGVLASRKTVWEKTLETMHRHPWFGTGFGTTNLDYDDTSVSMTRSASQLTREHGNSYLAITEWTGLLGVMPFFLLLALVLSNIFHVFFWMRRWATPFCYAIPVAAILAAGLVNAGFEDWLFAVGYHASVFFWSLALVLPDLIPKNIPSFGARWEFGPRLNPLQSATSAYTPDRIPALGD